MQEGHKSLGMLKNVKFGREPYITVDFRTLVSDLFHVGSSLVGSEPREKRGYQNSPEA